MHVSFLHSLVVLHVRKKKHLVDPLKEHLHGLLSTYVSRRIATASEAIRAAREAAASDGKSSAGDKYETTREMMQQEISRNEQLLSEAHRLRRDVEKLLPFQQSVTARPGSLVLTDQGCFFISISAGKLHVGDRVYFAIASLSPLGKALIGRSAGERVTFNGREYGIVEVY